MALQHAACRSWWRPPASRSGGGCEIVLHGARVQAAAESYVGLVEDGVGLHSRGRRHQGDAGARDGRLPPGADVLPHVQRVFETIGFAKVSTSGPQARELGFLRDGDDDHDEPRSPARGREGARAAAGRGLHAGAPRTAIRVGGEGVFATLKLGVHLAWRAGRISDHDAVDRPEARLDPRRRQPRASRRP
jgi:3-hydroxyacyl-CoA dehydrogenase